MSDPRSSEGLLGSPGALQGFWLEIQRLASNLSEDPVAKMAEDQAQCQAPFPRLSTSLCAPTCSHGNFYIMSHGLGVFDYLGDAVIATVPLRPLRLPLLVLVVGVFT